MGVNLLTLSGTYYEIGRQIGEMFSSMIRKYIEERYDTMTREFAKLGIKFDMEHYYGISDNLIAALREFAHNEYSELRGVADGSGSAIRDVIFAISYSDVFDVLYAQSGCCTSESYEEGCTSFVTSKPCNYEGKLYAGQNWDMPIGTESYIIFVHKKPIGEMDYYSLTTVLGLTHIGMNAQYTCIGTTNVATKDIGNGLFFAALIQKALCRGKISECVSIFKNTKRLSGHYYYVANREGAYAIEVSASKSFIQYIDTGIHVHANHYNGKCFQRDAVDYSPSSRSREAALAYELTSKRGRLELCDYKQLLSRHDLNLCRHPTMNEDLPSETCGSVLFCPADHTVEVLVGSPCKSEWVRFEINNG